MTLENASVAASALEAMDKGLDFADALHLASVVDCEAFVTFDQRFAKAARGVGDIAVRAL